VVLTGITSCAPAVAEAVVVAAEADEAMKHKANIAMNDVIVFTMMISLFKYAGYCKVN
jgi:hypothetical protein